MIQKSAIRKVLFWIECELNKIKMSNNLDSHYSMYEWSRGYRKGLKSIKELIERELDK